MRMEDSSGLGPMWFPAAAPARLPCCRVVSRSCSFPREQAGAIGKGLEPVV